MMALVEAHRMTMSGKRDAMASLPTIFGDEMIAP
jgi:hypothetical protein